MESRSVGFREKMRCDALRLSNHRGGRSERVPGSRVARAERWRSVAPQVPWWNAERRAPSDEGAPHRRMRRLRNSAFRRSAFLFCGAWRSIQTCRRPWIACRRSSHAISALIVTPRSHHRRRLTKIMPGRRLFVWSSAWLGREGAPRERWRYPPPRTKCGGGGPPGEAVEGAAAVEKNYEPRTMRCDRCPLHHRASRGGPPPPRKSAGRIKDHAALRLARNSPMRSRARRMFSVELA